MVVELLIVYVRMHGTARHGHRWEKHVEGRQLKGMCDELLRNLDTEALFR